MIACILHKGSGLGNQLARYVAVRCLALDKGVEFGVINPENFKGSSFLNLDMGVPVKDLKYEFYEAKIINEYGQDVRCYDEAIKKVKDFTLIDGEFQDERYFIHHLDEIREWLKPTGKVPYYDASTCIINFRGGEYVGVRDLFLPQEYWIKAIKIIKKIEPEAKFEVHTDDPKTAKEFFPDFEVVSNIELNWKAIYVATFLILSNSSFAILPALINTMFPKIIAPKYWAGYNRMIWQLPQNNYKKFEYIHHENK